MMNGIYKQLRNLGAIMLIVGLLMNSTGVLQAQSSADSDAEKNQQSQPKEKQKPKKTQSNERNRSDTFVPTEEISEDAPVAFPVDI